MVVAIDCKSARVPPAPAKSILTFGAKMKVASLFPVGGNRIVSEVSLTDFNHPF